MTDTTTAPRSPSPGAGVRAPWLPAALAGICAVGLAVYQVATPGAPQASYDSVSDWLREGLFTAYLLGAVLAAAAASRGPSAPRLPALAVVTGYGLILAGVTIGMVLQRDPEWFMLLGGPGLLLSTVGFIAWAVVGWRRGLHPAAVALLVGVGGPVAILGSELGLSVLAGGFWLWLAARLRG